MKKLIASASLVAVGAAGLQGQNAPGLTRTQTSKPWSVSATLRGFYDDNYATVPSSERTREKRDSFGVEVSPMASVNLPLDQTYFGASYRYNMKWYEDRDDNSVDQAHEARIKFDHRFNQRFDVYFNDVFVYAQEPELQDPNLGSPLRTEADAYRNQGKLGMNAMLSERIGLGLGYNNGYYNYTDSGDGSRSAQLDRMEHLFNVDGKYVAREDVTTLLGYQYGMVSYAGDDYLFPGGAAITGNFKGDVRDSSSHYVYVGGDADLTSTLISSIRVGVQYIDFDDLDEDDFSPYAQASLTYTYAPGSYLQGGIAHRRNATDVTGNPGDITTDQESTSLFASVSHRLTGKLTGSLLGQYQYSVFNNGSLDGYADNFYIAGANLEYQINQFLAADLGYNYDRLSSEIPNRSFTRNRVYLGIRASY